MDELLESVTAWFELAQLCDDVLDDLGGNCPFVDFKNKCCEYIQKNSSAA